MGTRNGNRQAVLGILRTTAWFIHNKAESGDGVVCFDEYVPYFSQWFECRGRGPVDDREQSLARLLEAVAPWAERPGLWVQCSPQSAAGNAEAEAMKGLGLYIANLRVDAPGSQVAVSTGTYIMGEDNHGEVETFLNRAAEAITPCGHPFSELIPWLEAEYGAIPHTLMPHELDRIRYELIQGAPEFQERMGDSHGEQMEWFYDHLEEIPPMDIRAFLLTKLKKQPPRGNPFRRRPVRKSSEVTSFGPEDVYVELEMTRELAGCGELADELTLWRGVTAEDIENRTLRFESYAYTLKRLGRL